MTIFRLPSFEDGESMTVDSKTALFGRVACTYRSFRSSPPGADWW